jgi:hypothetical protein
LFDLVSICDEWEAVVMRNAGEFWVIFSLAMLVAGGPSAVCEENAVEEQATVAERLVQQLGDEQFAVRERATTQLIRMGLPARKALEAGRTHPDREIRFRCERILSIVDELDFQHRLEAFAAGRSDGRDLPAWRVFRERFGDERGSRELFVEMQEAEQELMRAVDAGPQGVSRAVDERCQKLQMTQRAGGEPVGLGSIVALLFAASDENINLGMQACSVLYTLCRQPTMAEAMNDRDKQQILRPMMGQWIEHSQGWAAYQTLFLAMQYGLDEGLRPALTLLENPGEQAYARQQAILTVAKLGDVSHVPQLEAVLDDQTRCSAYRVNNITYETQIRDVALAAILILRKEDPKKFGFGRIQTNPTTVFATNTVGFENEDRRKQALAKYRQFRLADATEQ